MQFPQLYRVQTHQLIPVSILVLIPVLSQVLSQAWSLVLFRRPRVRVSVRVSDHLCFRRSIRRRAQVQILVLIPHQYHQWHHHLSRRMCHRTNLLLSRHNQVVNPLPPQRCSRPVNLQRFRLYNPPFNLRCTLLANQHQSRRNRRVSLQVSPHNQQVNHLVSLLHPLVSHRDAHQ